MRASIALKTLAAAAAIGGIWLAWPYASGILVGPAPMDGWWPDWSAAPTQILNFTVTVLALLPAILLWAASHRAR